MLDASLEPVKLKLGALDAVNLNAVSAGLLLFEPKEKPPFPDACAPPKLNASSAFFGAEAPSLVLDGAGAASDPNPPKTPLPNVAAGAGLVLGCATGVAAAAGAAPKAIDPNSGVEVVEPNKLPVAGCPEPEDADVALDPKSEVVAEAPKVGTDAGAD